MKVVIQKVKRSSVIVDNKLVNKIDKGLCILVGFTYGDSIEDIKYMVNKVINLRVFDDAITFKIALMVVKYMKYMESKDTF